MITTTDNAMMMMVMVMVMMMMMMMMSMVIMMMMVMVMMMMMMSMVMMCDVWVWVACRGIRDDIEQEDDQESYFKAVANTIIVGDDAEDEWDYDDEGNPIPPERSKVRRQPVQLTSLSTTPPPPVLSCPCPTPCR